MLPAGILAIGLVWGWLAGGALARRNWRAATMALIGSASQGLFTPPAWATHLSWYVAGICVGLVVHVVWLRSLGHARRVR